MVIEVMALAALSLTACEPAVGAYQAPIAWRRSVALGTPSRGRLRRGVVLPQGGPNHVTFDPSRQRLPNSRTRLWGTDTAVRRTLCVIDDYRADHPGWPRIVVGDLSRPRGGIFGPEFGGQGHVSHQNGLDIDVYLPRWDDQEIPPTSAGDVHLERAQELVDRFVAAGAQVIYVGPNTGLVNPGRRRVVRVLRNHDDHLHVRFRKPVR